MSRMLDWVDPESLLAIAPHGTLPPLPARSR